MKKDKKRAKKMNSSAVHFYLTKQTAKEPVFSEKR